MEVHPHESSEEYVMRGPFTRGEGNAKTWEDCRILSKFKVTRANGHDDVFCTIECRLRKDLGETAPFRPPLPVK